MSGSRCIRGEGGFALVGVIFLVVVLSTLGAYMVTLSVMQSRTSVLGLQGARAYHAAKSGLEWGTYKAVIDGDCDASETFAVGVFQVTVTCSSQQAREAGTVFNVFSLTSQSTFGTYGQLDFVSRSIRARVHDVP